MLFLRGMGSGKEAFLKMDAQQNGSVRCAIMRTDIAMIGDSAPTVVQEWVASDDYFFNNFLVDNNHYTSCILFLLQPSQ